MKLSELSKNQIVCTYIALISHNAFSDDVDWAEKGFVFWAKCKKACDFCRKSSFDGLALQFSELEIEDTFKKLKKLLGKNYINAKTQGYVNGVLEYFVF